MPLIPFMDARGGLILRGPMGSQKPSLRFEIPRGTGRWGSSSFYQDYKENGEEKKGRKEKKKSQRGQPSFPLTYSIHHPIFYPPFLFSNPLFYPPPHPTPPSSTLYWATGSLKPIIASRWDKFWFFRSCMVPSWWDHSNHSSFFTSQSSFFLLQSTLILTLIHIYYHRAFNF